MKLRDKIKDEAYFQNYFDDESYDLEDYQKSLDNNEIREDRILPVKKSMQKIKYHIMVAKYSAGYPLEDVKEDYIEVLNGMFQYWADDPELSRRINMVSIGIMLEIEDKYFDVLAEFIKETGEKEYAFDYLIHSRKPEWEISDKVRFGGTVFGWIKEVTQMSKSDAETFIAEYLERKWYSTHRDFYWYDNHKSKVNTYFGYWCFEVGAIVKIMGLDDSAFKDNQYYPYDLVHYGNGKEGKR
jgi:hypothetical protein